MPSRTKIVTSQIRYVAGSSEDSKVKLQTDLSIILYTDLILPLSIAFLKRYTVFSSETIWCICNGS